MLYSLSIENIAVIEQAEITLCRGFNVLTGETGAGKSIVIDSLNAALGRRTSRELIRAGAQSAGVTAEFQQVSSAVCRELEEMGIPCEGNTVILNRRMFADGRNACRINGSAATVAMLKSVGDRLVNIHGQHDSQALLAPEKHCGFIDTLAANGELRQEYRSCFSQLVAVKRELEALYSDEDEKAARAEFLDFQIRELENAALQVGEHDALTKEKALCQNAQKVKKSFQGAYAALTGNGDEGGAADALQQCFDFLNIAAPFSEEAKQSAGAARALCDSAGELAACVRRLAENFDFDAGRLAEIDERLDVIFRITRKYGGDEQSAVNALQQMKAERDAVTHSEERGQALEEQLAALSDRLKALAAALTASRKKAGSFFEKKVGEELAFLDMPKVRFVVQITPASFSSKGADNVEFFISANPGEEPKPIAKIASGGELSRMMLAIKNVLSVEDDVDTLIFDEIDTGVSGRAAQKIALKLKEVSVGRQVICVTHLPQIAAQGNRHFKICKTVEGEKTFTQVEPLGFEERARELARITGGLTVTQLQLQSAREMLLQAGIAEDKTDSE